MPSLATPCNIAYAPLHKSVAVFRLSRRLKIEGSDRIVNVCILSHASFDSDRLPDPRAGRPIVSVADLAGTPLLREKPARDALNNLCEASM